MHYFPEHDAPDLQPFTQAFVHLMFAHAAFERRVSDLMSVVACEPEFGERPENRWSARKRPKAVKKLIKLNQNRRAGGIPESDKIVSCLRSAIAPSDVRNMLAHGHWWAFDVVAGSIAVRAGIDWPRNEQHQDFTVASIRNATEFFEQSEVDLYLLQGRIEEREAIEPQKSGWRSWLESARKRFRSLIKMTTAWHSSNLTLH
jgi:hypothetical protein